jgi:hypothetical protein
VMEVMTDVRTRYLCFLNKIFAKEESITSDVKTSRIAHN